MVTENGGGHYTNTTLESLAEDIGTEVEQTREKMEKLGETVEMSEIRKQAIDRARENHWKLTCGKVEGELRDNAYQISQLVVTIDKMLEENGGSHYTNETLKVLAKAI